MTLCDFPNLVIFVPANNKKNLVLERKLESKAVYERLVLAGYRQTVTQEQSRRVPRGCTSPPSLENIAWPFSIYNWSEMSYDFLFKLEPIDYEIWSFYIALNIMREHVKKIAFLAEIYAKVPLFYKKIFFTQVFLRAP